MNEGWITGDLQNIQFAKRNAISAEKLKQDAISPHSTERVFEKSVETMASVESALSANVILSSFHCYQRE
jgi:hypothetical protein